MVPGLALGTWVPPGRRCGAELSPWPACSELTGSPVQSSRPGAHSAALAGLAPAATLPPQPPARSRCRPCGRSPSLACGARPAFRGARGGQPGSARGPPFLQGGLRSLPRPPPGVPVQEERQLRDRHPEPACSQAFRDSGPPQDAPQRGPAAPRSLPAAGRALRDPDGPFMAPERPRLPALPTSAWPGCRPPNTCRCEGAPLGSGVAGVTAQMWDGRTERQTVIGHRHMKQYGNISVNHQ